LIGFSQGATLSSVLCARKCGCDEERKQFESVVLVSGARPGVGKEWERVQKEARFGAKKSLHVIGETDATNPKALGFELAECFGGEEFGSEIVTHERGHIVPIDEERIVKKIIETLTGS
jgi:predicted esterase